MPWLRYFVFVGLALVGALFAADYLWPVQDGGRAAKAAATPPGAIDYWRQGQKRSERTEVAAIDLNGIATLEPTADRLQWERQLRYVPEGGMAVLAANAEINSEAAKAAMTTKPVADIPAPVRKRSIARLPTNARTAEGPRDAWRDPYRDAYRDSWRGGWANRGFGFFN